MNMGRENGEREVEKMGNKGRECDQSMCMTYEHVIMEPIT
jgi:hypothetical protein